MKAADPYLRIAARAAAAWFIIFCTVTPALADDAEFFEKKIRPVLVEHCFECHSGDANESGLRVDSLAGLIRGGERGSALVPGKPNESTLIRAVRHDDTLQMPPNRKLPQSIIADLTQWVEHGAVWPNAAPVTAVANPTNAERLPTEEDRAFWAFQSAQQGDVPQILNTAEWARTPVDRFILRHLELSDLRPNPVADKRTLIRRASLALLGLPPTPEEVNAFLEDDSPSAFQTVVDRLLSSPRYGERWGRHWLNLARYGDSNGLDENLAYGNAWRYRDYVVNAFNADVPYDEFLREQIAGDLLPPADSEEVQLRRVVATGFLSLGAKMLAEDDPVKMEMDIIDEQLDTLGKAVLGMTFGCARCHDHKFDPISMHDYYALAGIFKSSKTMENFSVVARWQERPMAVPEIVAERDRQKAVAEAVRAQIDQRVKNEIDRVVSEAKTHLAAYLLAAERQLQIEESLKFAKPIAEDEARRSAVGTLLLEAEDYARGNVLKDTANYGVGIGVLVNRGELPNFTEYDIEIPKDTRYQIDLRYAAAAARPTMLILDGNPVKADAAGQVTGSWTPESQKWFVEAIIEISAGRHVLRLENSGPFPHIDKLCLAPEIQPEPGSSTAAAAVSDSKTQQLATGLNEAAGDVQPVLHSLIVNNWAKYLMAQREVADGPFSPWWQLRTTRSLDDVDAAASSLLSRIVAEPKPLTLPELAQRYQELAESSDSPDLTPLQTLLTGNESPFLPGDRAEALFSEVVAAELKSLREEKTSIEKAMPVLPEAMSVTEGSIQNLRIHLRGSHTTPGEEVDRRMPRVFLPTSDETVIPGAVSGRRELAEWLTRPEHPLTARVMVNRVWQAHFGDGLVRSPDNFGRLGERPTHPELLDWLSVEFMRSGWSIKALHRLILDSAVWQQNTAWNEKAAELDPDNRLLWRMNRQRMDAEAVRDSLLAIGGNLDLTMGGSLLPTANRQYVTSTANINVEVYNAPRRTLYLPVVRSAIYDYLTAFDFGDPSAMIGQRDRTTVAPQALFLMNSGLVAKSSASLAQDLLAMPRTDSDRIVSAFERFYSRPATQEEIASSLQFLSAYEKKIREQGVPHNELRTLSWKAICRALMATNEFLYVN